jgi:hypothetical protein
VALARHRRRGREVPCQCLTVRGCAHGCDRLAAQRSSWIRTRLPAGSRKAQSRMP